MTERNDDRARTRRRSRLGLRLCPVRHPCRPQARRGAVPSRTTASARWAATVLALLLAGCTSAPGGSSSRSTPGAATEALPALDPEGAVTLTAALSSRRSVRDFDPAPLTRTELGRLLWAAQGITSPDGKRTAPSAGGLYPLEVYAATADGLLHYLPEGHRVELLGSRDVRAGLADVSAGQDWIADAPVVLAIVGVEARTAATYGERAERYVALEAGHAAQNVLLQAAALGLAATPIGAFDDAEIRDLLGLSDDHTPLELIPVGHPAASP